MPVFLSAHSNKLCLGSCAATSVLCLRCYKITMCSGEYLPLNPPVFQSWGTYPERLCCSMAGMLPEHHLNNIQMYYLCFFIFLPVILFVSLFSVRPTKLLALTVICRCSFT